MDEKDERDIRDRLVRLEEQGKRHATDIENIGKKIWAVIGLVLLAVGKRLIDVIGLGP